MQATTQSKKTQTPKETAGTNLLYAKAKSKERIISFTGQTVKQSAISILRSPSWCSGGFGLGIMVSLKASRPAQRTCICSISYMQENAVKRQWLCQKEPKKSPHT